MSEAKNILASKLMASYEFDRTAAIIMDALKIITEKDDSVDVSDVEEIIQLEIERRRREQEERMQYHQAWSPIKTYIKNLIKAAMIEMIHKNGEFVIPGNYPEEGKQDGDLFFSEEIMQKYEIKCEDSVKEDWSAEGEFTVSLTGKIAEQFKNNNVNVTHIDVTICGEEGEDIVEVSSISDIDYYIGDIHCASYEKPSLADLGSLADDLINNSNKYLFMHALKG